MSTIFWEALRESIHRRMSLALLLVGLLIMVLTFSTVSFRTEHGQLIAHRGTMSVAAKVFVQDQLQTFLQVSTSLWIFLGIFAVAPLLSSYLDKGHIELLLSKGIPRWKILLGRSAAAFCMFAGCIAMINGVPALYFWIRTGYSGTRFMIATLFVLLSFASLVAVLAMISLSQNGATVAIMAAFLQILLSSVLLTRHGMYGILTARWIQELLNWIYKIFPQNAELHQLATGYFRQASVYYRPIWTTAVFTVVLLALASWRFSRKSY